MIIRVGRECPLNFNPADFFIQQLAIVPGREAECKQFIQVSSTVRLTTFRNATSLRCVFSATGKFSYWFSHNIWHQPSTMITTTLWSEKNTPTHVFFYISMEKYFDSYRIFRVCLWGIRHYNTKVIYSLLLLKRKQFIKCLSCAVKPIYLQTCNMTTELPYVTGSNEYLIFMFVEYDS